MTYFEDFVSIAYQRKFDAFQEELASLTSKLAAEGHLNSGRRWVQTESVLLNQTSEYFDILVEKLMEYETEHSPISTQDFQAAIRSVEEFRQYCENLYEKKRDAGKGAYPKSRRPFEGVRMDRVMEEARQNIIGKELEFKSKRSFWKWAWGDTRKRAFTTIVMLVGAALGRLLTALF